MPCVVQDALLFDQPLSGWDVSRATILTETFANALSFDQELSAWNLSRVVSLEGAFRGATSFRQDLCGWPSALPVDATTTRMFSNTNCQAENDPVLVEGGVAPAGLWFCSSCDESWPLCFDSTEELRSAVDDYVADPRDGTDIAVSYGHPIRAWCVSAIEDFSYLFSSLRNPDMIEFNPDVSSWDTRMATDMSGMFRVSIPLRDGLKGADTSLSPLRHNREHL